MIDVAALAQIVAAVVVSGAAFYWGGAMHAMLRELKAHVEDHEERLRRVEVHTGNR